jgi:serine/threonine protein kinase
VACTQHPAAADHRGYCAACLLGDALVQSPDGEVADPPNPRDTHLGGMGRFSIQVPLGESGSSSVFLVKREDPPFGLLRLKTWKTPAPPTFGERFRDLQARLEGLGEDSLPAPLAAALDEMGCPWVLTEFRQGLPLLPSVKSGRMHVAAALLRLRALEALTRRAHARGLIHGSIVPGNILVQPETGAAYLLDFGLTPLVTTPGDSRAASADLAGFAAVARVLTRARFPPTTL